MNFNSIYVYQRNPKLIIYIHLLCKFLFYYLSNGIEIIICMSTVITRGYNILRPFILFLIYINTISLYHY